MTIYLKFPDEQTARDVLAGYIVDGEWLTASHAHDLTTVGVVNHSVGGAIEPCSGWHVNWNFGELPAAAAPYVVIPITPSVILG